jgi:transcriptional regulator with XRE-family HTH domain
MLLPIIAILKDRRKDLKLTQRYLAEMADVSVNTIFKIERGEANPTIDILEKIIDVLGMEIQLVVKDVNRL